MSQARSSLADQLAYAGKSHELLNKSRFIDIPKSAIEQFPLNTLIMMLVEMASAPMKSIVRTSRNLRWKFRNLSPIRTLPAEVMCFILRLVVSTCDYGGGNIRLTTDMRKGEFRYKSGVISLLSKVCSQWREIIRSDPSFWSNLHLSGRVVTSDFRAMSTCLEKVLLRSGTTVPMCLDVCFSGHSWRESDTVALFPILNALAGQANRWREAKLSFQWTEPHLVYMLEQVRSRTTNFPNLENLRLYTEEIFDPGFFGTMFSHCPRLHTLDMSSFRSTYLFDLRHLTTLTIYTYFGSSFAALLENCPCLEFFKLNQSIPDSESESSIPLTPLTVRHSHLARLEVEEIGAHSSIGFWQHVSLPKLTHVRATVRGIELNRNAFDEFKKMLIDSECILQEVYFIWYDNVLSDSVESLVQGMYITQPHVHFVSNEDRTDLRFIVIPPNHEPIFGFVNPDEEC
ncbi:hypothetical protein BT96DRAFT_1026782, partial [Gymnopus androsaceus JB14]